MGARSDIPWAWIVLAIMLAMGSRERPGGGRSFPKGAKKEARIPKRFSFNQLRELAAAAGMQDPDTAAAIAMAESGGRTDAVGDQGRSIGLWQINLESCPKLWRNADLLKHAGSNAIAAAEMSNGGTDWSAWTTYRNGAYRKYLPKGQ